MVTTLMGTTFKFTPSSDELYGFDTKNKAITMLNTVKNNVEGYTQRERKMADEAKSTFAKVAMPSINDYRDMIRLGLIDNCPVTEKDFENALEIYGPSMEALQGKTERSRPAIVRDDDIKVPRNLKLILQSVILDDDLMFVNRMPFLISVSQRIVFTTTEWIMDRKAETIACAISNVCVFYKQHGFQLKQLNCDIEFKHAAIDKVLAEHQCVANWCAAKEHVPRVERRIKTAKARFRAMRSHLRVFKRLPKVMVRRLVSEVTKWLNFFLSKASAIERYSPRMVVTGR